MRPINPAAFEAIQCKRIALIGMSGVGKTHLSRMLRGTGAWYHYSVDYRLGTAHLADNIDDDLRSHAMQDSTFSALLRADALTLRAKFAIDNLDVMSGYLGKLGNRQQGGMSRAEFLDRQNIHCRAEQAAMRDTASFMRRAQRIYGYSNFVCDTSGSLCSIVDPWDAHDPILTELGSTHLILYLEAEPEDENRLIQRFSNRPKPIFYSQPFFEACEREYLKPGQDWASVDPDAFAIWAYRRLLAYRRPRYEAIADGWGYRIKAADLAQVTTPDQMMELIRNCIVQAT